LANNDVITDQLLDIPNKNIVSELQADNIQVFEKIFKYYFLKLERFAVEYVLNKEEANDIVQSVFAMLWERRASLLPDTNLNNYLITLTKNQCLNYLKHLKAGFNYKSFHESKWKELEMNYYALERFNQNKLSLEELEKTIQDAIDSLPGQCREIFMLSRFQDLKYHEIADKLNISVKTVEKKMSISLSILREKLREYYSFIWILF
jgi:RNA polymerase sigma-70 factor, ECF subfamily